MTLLIAEIGVNHNGCPDLLERLIVAAKSSGAHACKFQTFKAERLAKKDTPKVNYQLSTSDPDESHWQMLKNLELSDEMHLYAKKRCEDLGMDFISTPYDPESVEYLHSIGVKIVKTASADVVDHRIHNKIAELGMKAIIAVGMASMTEIREMMNIYKGASHPPALLHCVSNYPCSYNSLNLACITTLKNEFSCEVGFSDHSKDSLAASLSVALGATIIEKHFTLDKEMEGPDHKASTTPDEFTELVKSVTLAKKILGKPFKSLQKEEKHMHSVSRKSVCLINGIKKGQPVLENNLTMLRPGNGLNGKDYYLLIGKKAKTDLPSGCALSWEHFE